MEPSRTDASSYKVSKCRTCSKPRLVPAHTISDECSSCSGIHGSAGNSNVVRHSTGSVATGSAVAATASNNRQPSSSTHGPSLISLADLLNAMKANTAALNDLKSSQIRQTTHLNENLEALYDLTAENVNKIESLDAKMLTPDRYSKSLRELQNEVKELTAENHRLQQRLLEKTIEISGIPHRKDESLPDLIVSVGNALGVRLELSDIDDVSRSRSGKSSSKLPLVIASFIRASTVQKLLSGARKFKLDFTTEDLGWSGGTVNRIYLHESLTTYSKNLFKAARAAKTSNIVKHAWTKRGTVYVRQGDDTPIIRVVTIEDIPEKDL